MEDPFAITIKAHDEFFGKLISLIPTDLYRHTRSDPEVTQSMYYKHRKLPLQASEKKLLSQKNRAERYKGSSFDEDGSDNDASNSVGDDDEEDKERAKARIKNANPVKKIGGGSIAASRVVSGSGEIGEESGDDEDVKDNEIEAQQQVLLDTLKAKLQDRLNNIKSGKISAVTVHKKHPKPEGGGKEKSNNSNHSSSNNNNNSNSRKRERSDIRSELMAVESSGVDDNKMDINGINNNSNNNNGNSNRSGESSGDVGDIAFSIKTGDEKLNKDKSGKPGTKKVRLTRMIEEVEAKRRRLDALKGMGDAGETEIKRINWSDALEKAAGAKGTEDPRKLKKALKRIDNKKVKSSKEWRDRLESVEAEKDKRQEKRDTNIADYKSRIQIKPKLTTTATNSNSSNSNSNNNSGSSNGKARSRAGFEGKKQEILNNKMPSK